jgi:hypothetical protein
MTENSVSHKSFNSHAQNTAKLHPKVSCYWSHEFDVRVTVHRDKFYYNKPTRCTNFSNLIWKEGNSACFGQFLCPSSGIFHFTHSNGICHTGMLTACEQDQDGTLFHPDPVSKPV